MPCLHPRSFGSSVRNKNYGTIFGGTDEGFLIQGLIGGGGGWGSYVGGGEGRGGEGVGGGWVWGVGGVGV